MQMQNGDILGKMETQRDSSHNQSAPVNEGLISKDRKGEFGGEFSST